jgi:hypothetical protein
LKEFINPKIKRHPQQNENPRFEIDTFDCFCNPFFCFLLFDVPFPQKGINLKKWLEHWVYNIEKEAGIWMPPF